ncbi:shikimate dehydrogenase [Acetobacter musti]|uniref:shikimate dehydrogenase (NADP(+)) n=1 Tax=Acetobacter musti TaxID=864732 RepID=A0ABX0JMP5_9PROT|nr:shikimate dehydrogenase [Acetobacter musti]NHN83332.1 shikimate dehydrogenase [Acetobacter musti]
MTSITGKTKLFATLGYPVGHVLTPQKMNALFAERHYDGVMVAVAATPGQDLARVVAAFRAMRNFGGAVVTVPHKTGIVTLCDHLSPRAANAGAVNVIRREADGSITGDLLDGVGFVTGLQNAGETLKDRRVLLAGAGGAALAIAFALAEAGVAHITVTNRSQDRLDALISRLKNSFPRLSVSANDLSEGHDIAINATSLGLRENDPLPIAPEHLRPPMLVAEVVMMPEQTGLLKAAGWAGCRTHSGRHMLTGQLSAIFDFLTAA